MKAYFRINGVEVVQSGKTFTIHQDGKPTAEKGTDFAAMCARAVDLAMAVPRVTTLMFPKTPRKPRAKKAARNARFKRDGGERQ